MLFSAKEQQFRKTTIIALFLITFIGIYGFGYAFINFEFHPSINPTSTTTYTYYTTNTGITNEHPNPFEVAIVFSEAGLGDIAINDACLSGAQWAHDDFGVEYTYVEPEDSTDYEYQIRSYAQHNLYDDPYDIIICVGYEQSEALQIVSLEFPQQKFAIVDMIIDNEIYPNVKSLWFKENEGSALVGAIAGLMTTQNHIGFIGGMDIPLTDRYLAGYIWGANYSNPGINFDISYTNDWYNTGIAQHFADVMYDSGIDIIYAASGPSGLGVIDTCDQRTNDSEYPLWVIGTDNPHMHLGGGSWYPDDPTCVLTSMLKMYDVAIYNVIQDVHEGLFSNDTWYGSLENSGVSYEINERLLVLPDDVIGAVFNLRNYIIANPSFVPFDKYWE